MLQRGRLVEIRKTAEADLTSALLDYDDSYRAYKRSFVDGVPDIGAQEALERARRAVTGAATIIDALTIILEEGGNR